MAPGFLCVFSQEPSFVFIAAKNTPIEVDNITTFKLQKKYYILKRNLPPRGLAKRRSNIHLRFNGKITDQLRQILDNILNRLNHPVEYIRLGKTCKALNQSNVKPNPRSKKTGTWKQIVSRKWKCVCDGCFGVSVKSDLNSCRIMAADTAGKTCWTCFVKEWREYHNSLPEFAKEPILRQTRMKKVKWEVVEILKGSAMKLYGLKRHQMSVLKCRMTTNKNWSHYYVSHHYHLHEVKMLGAFVSGQKTMIRDSKTEDERTET
ncbi:hypothetical protein BC829DRAFT_421013 [Chytridium lagenaria]|nr:hypothetical protein BC829DRAFT_421013 [Chytridium lagenaria]